MTQQLLTARVADKANTIFQLPLALLAAVGVVLGIFEAPDALVPLVSGALGTLAIVLAFRGPARPQFSGVLSDGAVLAAFGALARGGLEAWQAPQHWVDVLHLTPNAGALAATIYMGVAMTRALQGHGHLPLRAAGFLLAAPLLLKALFILTSPPLLTQLGQTASFGVLAAPLATLFLGRLLTLFGVAEAMVVGLGFVLDRRLALDLRLHALLFWAAAFTAVTPIVADWGSSAAVAASPGPVRIVAVVAASIVAQAGLWSFTYLLTGSIMDALRHRRPSWTSCAPQWRAGASKAAIYGGVFMLLLHLIATVEDSTLWALAVQAAPVMTFIAAGALAFPFVKTVIESFDGSAPFLGRLKAAYCAPWTYLRGLLLGLSFGLVAAGLLSFSTTRERLLFGLIAGAAAYAGADLLRDSVMVLIGRRRHLQTVRLYLLGGGLGGIVGAALASYFDAAQVAVVTEKFAHYVAVSFPQSGLPVSDYVIYPLFSKWGATDLGPVSGGVRLFFNESLSGVINWSFAAPLFSINLVLLTALVHRDTAPIRRLVGTDGLINLVEQAFRVQRWGLWMAPVIYSFLRLQPEPSWYNQDGAIRTLVASVMAFHLPAAEFHNWSLTLFLGLLAYDWLRVAIWFDHMGLRVASLVNASFVVGDWLDERAARWLGHGARTRIIPEGIRRFATWAPLLIPFYIPRGVEWDEVWAKAEQIHGAGGRLLAPVHTLLMAYAGAGVVTALGVGVFMLARPKKEQRPKGHNGRPHCLTNGNLTLEIADDGRGFLRVASALRPGATLDLTRRPANPYEQRGLFFYVHEEGAALSSVLHSPCGAAAGCRVSSSNPTGLSFVTERPGLSIETTVTIAQGASVAHWRIRLINREAHARKIELTSFREIALADWESYERHPSYQSLFVGTSFVRGLNAVIAHNRKLHAKGEKWARREVMFHAVGFHAQDGVALTGYQDSRTAFLGFGTAAAPEGLQAGRMLAPNDEGTAFTFDPAASLTVSVPLPAHGTVEIYFADGYATSEADATQLIARFLGGKAPDRAMLARCLTTTRATTLRRTARERGRFLDETPAFATGIDTPQPFSHVLANAQGHGAIVTNDGSIFSFAGNSQQNGLTPFIVDTVPSPRIGQTIYVHDLETGVTETPGFVPYRRADAAHETVFGRGHARLHMRRGVLELDHLIVLPPEAPIELRLLTIRNLGSTPKRYRVTPYFEMVLAELPANGRNELEVRGDLSPQALFYANPKNSFEGGWVFVATNLPAPARETWRARFVGAQDRDLTNPLFTEHSSAGDDLPDDNARIASFSGIVEVAAGGEAEIVLMLGRTKEPADAAALIARYGQPKAVKDALAQTQKDWAEITSVLRIETNNPGFDRLVNDWLPYQVLAARLWGRLGPNQRSGGYGFRDQLQDVLPFSVLKPEIARAQILRHAAQQFLEGDVLQWWHSDREGHTGLGARNRASDPHLWLPYIVSGYVDLTGDTAILDEPVRYLEGMGIPPGQEGVAFAPRPSRDVTSLYDHCVRAIKRTLKAEGAHGLPLMGTGDWNDGLSAVGAHGKGESVWLGFFLYGILQRFAELSEKRGTEELAERFRARADKLSAALDGMWRGNTYVRAVTDRGEEMCFADALVAAWPALSGAVGPERGLAALETARKALEKDSLVVLLEPAFTPQTKPAAGRISDYPPGVRENGGQYTHGVSWLIDAYAKLAADMAKAGNMAEAERLAAQAAALWVKISPLGHEAGETALRYGLPPHQQPADIYFGPGYEGRGGWSWYTGAAARMLSAAYAMLGLEFADGALSLQPHAFAPKGPITLKRVTYRGKDYRA